MNTNTIEQLNNFKNTTNMTEASLEFVVDNNFYQYFIENELIVGSMENRALIPTPYIFDGNAVNCTDGAQQAFLFFCNQTFSVCAPQPHWACLISFVLSQPLLCRGLFSLATNGVVLTLGNKLPVRHVIDLSMEEDSKHMENLYSKDLVLKGAEKEILTQERLCFMKILKREVFRWCADLAGLPPLIESIPKTSVVSLVPLNEAYPLWPAAQVPRDFANCITSESCIANGFSEPSKHYVECPGLDNKTNVSERYVPQSNVGPNPPSAIQAQDFYLNEEGSVVRFPAPPSRRP